MLISIDLVVEFDDFVVAISIPSFLVITANFLKLAFDLHISKFGRLMLWMSYDVNLEQAGNRIMRNLEAEMEFHSEVDMFTLRYEH